VVSLQEEGADKLMQHIFGMPRRFEDLRLGLIIRALVRRKASRQRPALLCEHRGYLGVKLAPRHDDPRSQPCANLAANQLAIAGWHSPTRD
jgi:hypothetical protein